ncbi:MAG TPA: MFS transporter [Streptosporangiaceae bacterium]|nr:MFS transporter [Streptosporangiaceae bacterium]
MTPGTRPRLTLAVACTAQIMMVLDVMIVSVALPSLQRELRLSPAGLEWVVSAYALALAALIPTSGALGDHFGRKRIFIGGLVLFTLASVGCALSVSGGMLIAFRVLQGIGGAVMSSLTLALITEAYPPQARAGPIGLWAAVSGLAVAGGSVVGGLLLSVFPWSSIFWVNVPIGIAALVICQLAVAESREPVPRPFDICGVMLSAVGLLLLTFGFVDAADATWRSPLVAASVIAGAAILVAFFMWERRAASPMVPPALLRTASFSRACAVYLLAYLAFAGFIYYVTLFFQNVDGWSPLRTGLSWLFFCLPYFAVAQLGGWVQRRLPVAQAVGSGCFIAALGVLGMSQLTTATAFAWPAACYVLVGVGFGLMVPAVSAAAMAQVPAGSSGIGSGLFNACRQIGTATGLAILGSVGSGVILADWHRNARYLPPAAQQRAVPAGPDVAGGRVHVAAALVGGNELDRAVVSFLAGFEVTLLLAGAILVGSGVVGFLGLRRLQSAAARHHGVADARINR